MLRIAVYWTGACGGCDVSFLELGTGLLDVLADLEIVFWPALVDAKRDDLDRLPRHGIDVALVNGTIRTAENVEVVEVLRDKSRLVVAYGACAHLGGVPGLANLASLEEMLGIVCADGFRREPPPGGGANDAPTAILPAALPLAAVAAVDYVVPGCPPPAALIARLFDALRCGDLPDEGHVFANEKAVCEECPRTREDRRLVRIYRPHELLPEAGQCLLDQGVICVGPVTRGGCDAACPRAAMPCTGCLGPTPKAGDPGLAMISALASLVRTGDEGEDAFDAEDRVLDGLVDPLGTLYKYSLPTYWQAQRPDGPPGASPPSRSRP